MLKILILFALTFNFAFAKSRFTDADQKKFMEEVKQGIAAHKVENKGKVDLQIIKPGLYDELDVYYKQEKFTREEMVTIKKNYEDFAKKPTDADKTEEAFYKFVENQLSEINKTQVTKTKEGQVCNNWSCEDGLKCAPDPKQKSGPKCSQVGLECKDDGDCCSSSCTLNKKKNKRYCEEVYRCFKPLNLGQSCLINPVCGEGECLAFNSNTSGIGECSSKGKSCKKNVDCCSNSCESNRCSEAYICKDCVKNGKKPERGQKCCEGLYLNDKGICVPDVPPSVLPQVRTHFIEKTFIAMTALFISSAQADEAYDTVNADHDTYENFRAESAQADRVTVKAPVFTLERKSDFKTCDIRFRDDFSKYLKTNNLLDLELALVSFDFMLSGDGVNDYWTRGSDPSSSIYGRLKNVAIAHQALRKTTNEKIDKINRKLTCMCLDVVGHDNIKDPAKKSFFETCEEYTATQAGDVCYKDTADGPQTCASGEANCNCVKTTVDKIATEAASGVKGKKLITVWTQNLQAFNASLTVDNTSISKQLADISQWSANEAKWNDADTKTYSLFTFSMKNPSGSVAAMGAILGALLAAGIIAVMGGFATTSILTAWAAAGIIATSAITGGTGLWLIASLKGAWISKRPEVVDKFVRSYSCGKKETCQDWDRTLKQPFNKICNVHTSANACIKNFVVSNKDLSDPRYIVDPWIPNGVAKTLIIRDANDDRDYAHKLEDGFQAAKNNMIAKNPGAVGGGGDKGGGAYVSEDYMRTLFVDSDVLGSYTPKIGVDDKRYILDDKIIAEIKKAAIGYAIKEKFFFAEQVQNPSAELLDSKYCTKISQEVWCSKETENLDKFADYTYEYHFLWPKTSRSKEISYPTVGLTTYLDLMSNGVAGTLAVGAGNASKTFGNLNSKYLEDYLNTLQLYRDQPINQSDATRLKLLDAQINQAKKDLNNQLTLNALMAGNTDLSNLNAAGISTAAKGAGISGNVSLTADQSSFLNAIGTLRNTRKEQLKKLDTYKKAIATSGNADRATKVASASKNFAASFAKPLSGSKGLSSGIGLFGSGGTDGLGIKDLSDDNKKSDKNKFSGAFGGGLPSGGASSSTGVHLSPGKSTSTDDQNAASAIESGTGSGLSDEDSKKLAEAIEARNKANKDKYSSKEEQTLFEKVTNAYIRNYDKVLTKKKDKDVTEQK